MNHFLDRFAIWVGILVLGAGAAWMLSPGSFGWGSRPVRVSTKNSCIANLKQITGAIEQWGVENRRKPGDPVTPDDISGGPLNYLRSAINEGQMQCREGGTYTMTCVGEFPRCSIPDHVLSPR